MQEVVVTGYGVFTAFGFGSQTLKENIFSGEPAFTKVQRFDASPYRAQYAAEYPGPLSQLTALRECVDERFPRQVRTGRTHPFCWAPVASMRQAWTSGPFTPRAIQLAEPD